MTVQQQLDSGVSHQRAGRLAEAERIYRQILARQPNHAEALLLLGTLAVQAGKLDAAVELFSRSVQVKPELVDAQFNLGLALQRTGKLEEAVAAYRSTVELKPDHVDAQYNLGTALQNMGRLDEAISAYRRTISLKPDHAEAFNNLGNALRANGQPEEAVAACRRAIELKPDYSAAHVNLGAALVELKRLDEAIGAFRNALRLKPDLAEAHYNLANALKDLGQFDEAIASYRKAIGLKPGFVLAHSNLVFTLPYHPSSDADMIYTELRRWNQQHAEPLKKFIQPHSNNPDPERRLRIGYVSPDFCDHVVGHNLLPLFREHNHAQMEIFCYSNVLQPDAITEQFRRCADVWHGIVGLPDSHVVDLIRNDRIDILVDLALHSANNRLLIFARKPAPVQATFAGYPGSTGMDAIDYRMTDPYLDPPGLNDQFYSEKSIRLRDSFWCLGRPLAELDVNSLPAQTHGFVTFGCLNNFRKVNERVLRLWALVLKAVERSRLMILCPDGSHRQSLLNLLRPEGIDPDRIDLIPRVAPLQYLELYHRIDLGLDTFPYNGHTTSLDSFWMGVPVVTLVGKTVVGRAGLSQLTNLDLTELIAHTPEQYVQIAAGLAGDLSRLAELRRTLRSRMQASPLMDAPRFARSIEAAYRQMWRTWCAGTGLRADDAGQLMLQQLLESGTAHHRAGRFAEAQRIYRGILAQQPDHADALHLLGTLSGEMGQFDTAIDLIRRAIAICPTKASFHSNLGNSQRATGQIEQAVASYRQAVRLRPGSAAAYSNLGTALLDLGQFDDAIAACRRAIELRPEFGHAHYSLGIALNAAGQIDQAIASFRQAIQLQPDSAHAHNNLGAALKEKGRMEEAVASYRQAIRAKPDFADAYSNLGIALREMGQLDEAITSLRLAIRLKPDHAAAHNNMGIALSELGRPQEAVSYQLRAIELDPEMVGAHWNLSITCLQLGDFERGLPEYEWRMKGPRAKFVPNFPFPRWDGSDLNGKTIFLYPEQGLGDVIQFVRYVPMVAAKGGRIVLGCQDALRQLLQSIPNTHRLVTSGDQTTDCDVYCPLMSLPLVFKTVLATIPASIPYLQPPPALVENWRQRLGPRADNLRVGIVWAGNPDHEADCARSMQLAQMAPLAAVKGIELYSLQKGPPAVQALNPPPGMTLVNFTDELIDFADTAALIQQLDLVICVDTAVAHLAGAIGKPVWVLLSKLTDWRWLLDREDCPWYSTMRLFRQTSLGDWAGVVERVAQALDAIRIQRSK